MNKLIYRYFRKGESLSESPDFPQKVQRAIVALFCRYGAGVQALQAVQRFMSRHPDCRIEIVTSPQLSVYVKSLLKGDYRVHIVPRSNPLALIRTVLLLRHDLADIGFNPWSNGPDGLFYGGLASYFFSFSKFWKFCARSGYASEYRNFHDLLDAYFGAGTAVGDWDIQQPELPDRLSRILVCPESSGPQRTLGLAATIRLIERLQDRWPMARIALSASDPNFGKLNKCAPEDFLLLRKDARSSAAFIAQIKMADFIVAVDSGPLNIAVAMGKPALALFSCELPERVLPRNMTNVRVVRDPAMAGISCQNSRCSDPACLNALLDEDHLFSSDRIWQRSDSGATRVVEHGCPWKEVKDSHARK